MDCPTYQDIMNNPNTKKMRKKNEIEKWNKWVSNTKIKKTKKNNKVRFTRFEKVDFTRSLKRQINLNTTILVMDVIQDIIHSIVSFDKLFIQ